MVHNDTAAIENGDAHPPSRGTDLDDGTGDTAFAPYLQAQSDIRSLSGRDAPY